jgi:hypothetical protein
MEILTAIKLACGLIGVICLAYFIAERVTSERFSVFSLGWAVTWFSCCAAFFYVPPEYLTLVCKVAAILFVSFVIDFLFCFRDTTRFWFIGIILGICAVVFLGPIWF